MDERMMRMRLGWMQRHVAPCEGLELWSFKQVQPAGLACVQLGQQAATVFVVFINMYQM
jgi:hypothetical protein